MPYLPKGLSIFTASGARIGINYETAKALIEGYVSKGIRIKNPPFNQERAIAMEIIDKKIDNSEILTYEEFQIFKTYSYDRTFMYEPINNLVDYALKSWLKRI